MFYMKRNQCALRALVNCYIIYRQEWKGKILFGISEKQKVVIFKELKNIINAKCVDDEIYIVLIYIYI